MQFLLYFAVTITIIFVVKLLLMLIGIGSESDIDISNTDGVGSIGAEIVDASDVDGAMDIDIDVNVEAPEMELDGDSLNVDHGHIHSDHDSSSAFVLFSLDSILAFLMVFSWSLLLFSNEMKISFFPSLAMAAVIAFIVMYGYSFLLFKMKKLETKEVVDVLPALEQEGVMYLSTRNGKGQAKFSVNGKFIIYDVYIEDEEKSINTGELIKVQTISNNFIYIVKK